jgi:hypothetical protein
MRFILLIPFLFACSGYKPSSQYVHEVVGENIYASVKTIIEEPENSFLIEDALKEALQTRLDVRFSSRENADSELYLTLKSLEFRPLQYEDGYVILYRTEVVLKARHIYKIHGISRTSFYTLNGFYEFPVRPNVSISMAIKFDAIKSASLKAIDTLIPKLSHKGSKFTR